MANPDRARKLLVRSALVTSTTIATFLGAQNLAMLDTRQFELLLTPSPEVVNMLPPTEAIPPTVQAAAPTLVIQQAAPSIIILRQSANPGSGSQPTPFIVQQLAAIQPPAPAVISVPAPVIVQQPIRQSSRSSR